MAIINMITWTESTRELRDIPKRVITLRSGTIVEEVTVYISCSPAMYNTAQYFDYLEQEITIARKVVWEKFLRRWTTIQE